MAEWWPEARCAKAWGHVVRPDGNGRWQERGRCVDFFLEYDTGTETLGKVASKAERYSELARRTGIVTPVLIVFPTARREANFRAARFPVPLVPLATTAEPTLTDHTDEAMGPAGPVWAPLDGQGERRVRLTELAPPERDRSGEASLTRARPEEPESSAWRTRPTEDLP